ncbi:hypothetical protein [Thalassotalea crassostreae]|uniref:hypothetical protein n=1 Tax=Thalassotalea crassostreae TaxID=1763536 RepID=UPI000838FC63|nr:hypothetical protein [Thalassotalea crassostreae]
MHRALRIIVPFLLVCNLAIAAEESDKSKDPQTLDKSNMAELERLAGPEKKPKKPPRYIRKRYPKLPPNFDRITRGNVDGLCDSLMKATDASSFRASMEDIRKYYGDPREFFYKYAMSLPCYYPSASLGDFLLKRNFLNSAFSTTFKKFGRLDPNTFVIIKREGLIFEGPLHVVYKHLEENFKDSPLYGPEYRNITRRLTVKKFVNGTPKSCKELQKEDPDFPCILPMPIE